MGVSKGKGCGWAPNVPSALLGPLYQKSYDRHELGTYGPSKKPAPSKPDLCKAVLPPLPTRAQACAAKNGDEPPPSRTAIIIGIAGAVAAVAFVGVLVVWKRKETRSMEELTRESKLSEPTGQEKLLNSATGL